VNYIKKDGSMKKEILENLIKEKKTIRDIAKDLNTCDGSVRYWLKRYGLKTIFSGGLRGDALRTWTKDQMIDAIKTSVNISDVLRKIGLKIRPGNYSTFKKFVALNKIDISHLKGKNSSRCSGGGKKVTPLKEILKENSFYSRYHLKSRLLKDGLLKNECSICKSSAEWNGKSIVMILDHINGNNVDNRLENLRMLCPNCNSQQSTFCRNVKKEKAIPRNQKGKCIDCYKPICGVSKRCRACRGIHDRKTSILSKEELKKMISETTWTDIGRKYGVSDNTVRKWAKQYGIIS
jgi:transposase-like protein